MHASGMMDRICATHVRAVLQDMMANCWCQHAQLAV